MHKILDEAKLFSRKPSLFTLKGVVTDVTGLIIKANGPRIAIGSQVLVSCGTKEMAAEIVGFQSDKVLVMPYGLIDGLAPGATVLARGLDSTVEVSESLLGRIVDARGNPLDGKECFRHSESTPLHAEPPNPVTRKKVDTPFDVGVRAINSLLTVGIGQRVAIMAGSGVGKSTLLGMIAQHSQSDVNVIALVGERGREVREFIERDLGEEGLKRSVVVVATGDSSALLRLRAGFLATAYAEYFRAQGKKVNLLLDSVTRMAMAQREVGLAVGEPPSTRGYTPSVFAMLPRLLERAGTCEGEGSITGFYTVLVEGDDMNEPIADAVRGILDGHIVLSRKLAGRGHFPAIETLESVSRVAKDIITPEAYDLAFRARDILATYRDTEDLITIGAYKPGQNQRVDNAVQREEGLRHFLCQKAQEHTNIEDSWSLLKQVVVGEVENSSKTKKR
jgi:flagellum-specific ATP synthase